MLGFVMLGFVMLDGLIVAEPLTQPIQPYEISKAPA